MTDGAPLCGEVPSLEGMTASASSRTPRSRMPSAARTVLVVLHLLTLFGAGAFVHRVLSAPARGVGVAISAIHGVPAERRRAEASIAQLYDAMARNGHDFGQPDSSDHLVTIYAKGGAVTPDPVLGYEEVFGNGEAITAGPAKTVFLSQAANSAWIQANDIYSVALHTDVSVPQLGPPVVRVRVTGASLSFRTDRCAITATLAGVPREIRCPPDHWAFKSL